MSEFWQWFGLWTTVAGTLAGLAGLIASVAAARRAKSAERAAREAVAAAGRLHRGARLAELGEELAVLSAALGPGSPAEEICRRIDRLTGRLSQFQAEHGPDLPPAVAGLVERANEQLAGMAEVALNPRLSPAGRTRRLWSGYNLVVRFLSTVRGHEQRRLSALPPRSRRPVRWLTPCWRKPAPAEWIGSRPPPMSRSCPVAAISSSPYGNWCPKPATPSLCSNCG